MFMSKYFNPTSTHPDPLKFMSSLLNAYQLSIDLEISVRALSRCDADIPLGLLADLLRLVYPLRVWRRE